MNNEVCQYCQFNGTQTHPLTNCGCFPHCPQILKIKKGLTMTDKLECPFCGAGLEEFGGGDFPLLHYCDNTNCAMYHIMGQYTLWQALIQAKQDLEIVLKTLKKADAWFGDNQCLDPAKWIRRTVKQIKQKETK